MSSLTSAIILFIIGLILIVKCGDYFVDSASFIAQISGIPKFIIGATIVSVATTLPEMLVSFLGAAKGNADGIAIATGNAVGSVTANTGLILAISVICIPAVIKRKYHAFKFLLLLFVSVVLWAFSFAGVFPNDNRLSFIGSIILLLCFIAFIFENIKQAKSSVSSDKEKLEFNKKTLIINIIKFVGGVTGIVIGARLLVDNANVLAVAVGVPTAVISATIVAIGTSLPELVTTVTAIVKKESSLSVGNVVGANIIDISVILPICSLISGQDLPVSKQNILLDMPICIIIIAILLIPALIRKKFSRAQGIIALLVYIAYIIAISVFLDPILNII